MTIFFIIFLYCVIGNKCICFKSTVLGMHTHSMFSIFKQFSRFIQILMVLINFDLFPKIINLDEHFTPKLVLSAAAFNLLFELYLDLRYF